MKFSSRLQQLVCSAAALVAMGAAARAEPADLVLYNGHVLTVDSRFSTASALAVKGGKILAVGGGEIHRRFHGRTEIDLKGRTLLPGFTDTHVHPFGRSPRSIDMSKLHSIAELKTALAAKAHELGPGQWITGYGWQEAQFAENRNLTKGDLDPVTPSNPVVLTRAGGHSAVGNSAALNLAGIVRSTPDPAKGLIEHGADGEPNGIIRERHDLYVSLVPPDKWADVRQSYVDRLRWFLSLGITSVFDASGTIDDEPVGQGGIADPPPALTFRRAREIYAEQGDALPRLTLYIAFPGEARLKAFGHHTGFGDDRVRLGPIGENAVDGGFTGPTAWLLADYKGQPGFRGKGRYTDEELQSLVDISARYGWQLGLHCIGDAAIVQTVKAYDLGLSHVPGQDHQGPDRRWFTDHFVIMPPDETMSIMEKDSIRIAAQPNFEYDLEDRYEQTLDPWRLEHNNPVATPADKFHIPVAFGSDNLPIGPMVGLYAAITRKGRSGRVHGAEEAVSRETALRLYTAAGPYLSWEETTKGTLEVGKLADMIVLPADPLTVPADELLHLQVDMTFVGGKLVYDRTSSKGPDLSPW